MFGRRINRAGMQQEKAFLALSCGHCHGNADGNQRTRLRHAPQIKYVLINLSGQTVAQCWLLL